MPHHHYRSSCRKAGGHDRGAPAVAPDVLAATMQACRRNYGRFLNLMGVGCGLKFTGGQAAGRTLCIHFYVARKTSALPRGQRLPRFVHARTAAGTVDYSRRIPTDVIAVGTAQFALQAGTEILNTGNAGTVTLVFNNLAEPGTPAYLITCAHVVGDLTRSPPVHPIIRHRSGGGDLAQTVACALASQGVVEYDIALARLLQNCAPGGVLRVAGAAPKMKLSNFLAAAAIQPGLEVACAFPVSRLARAVVASARLSLPINMNGQAFLVQNLFLLDQRVLRGDSGGLLYCDGVAVGILVAMSDDGLGLFQPLGEAVEFLQQLSPITIRCF